MASGEKSVVAFLGPEASYTHQATLSRFPQPQHTLSPRSSISAVFTAVHSGHATHGVVPFENSSNGSVVFTLDLFASAATQFPTVHVTGEIYLPVRHCLVGIAPPAPPASAAATAAPDATGSPHSHINKLYSHPQAWGQCKAFLATHFPSVERQDVSSTSAGAALSAADPRSAAIASSLAATANDIAVLAEGIEDVRGNSTRFLIISSSPARPQAETERGTAPAAAAAAAAAAPAFTTAAVQSSPLSWKTLVTFTLNHHGQPGALADSLAVFKKFGINLTSINSRPSGEKAWHYVFFVEFQGRRRGDREEGKGPVDEALLELSNVTKSWRWLGSWKNALPGEEDVADR